MGEKGKGEGFRGVKERAVLFFFSSFTEDSHILIVFEGFFFKHPIKRAKVSWEEGRREQQTRRRCAGRGREMEEWGGW